MLTATNPEGGTNGLNGSVVSILDGAFGGLFTFLLNIVWGE